MNGQTLADYPNIFVVSGPEFPAPPASTSDYGSIFIDNMDSIPDTLVNTGSHHFIVIFHQPDFSGVNWGRNYSAVPTPALSYITISSYDDIRTLLEEIGHAWGVYKDKFAFLIDGTYKSALDNNEFARMINEDLPFGDQPLICGRENMHYSSYFQADSSPMDGLAYDRNARESGYAKWKQVPFAGAFITPGGMPPLPPLQVKSPYCDLDLVLMGELAARNAYYGQNHKIFWIEPKLVAPLDYQVGLLMIMENDDQIFFGYDQHHKQLSVLVNWVSPPSAINKLLIDDYAPLENDYHALSLRIVRRGNDYHFQAKKDNSLTGCVYSVLNTLGLTTPRIPDFFDDLEDFTARTSSGPMEKYRTFSSLPYQNSTPKYIGTVVRKNDGPSMIQAAFYNMEVMTTERKTYLTDAVPSTLSPTFVETDVHVNQIYLHVPKIGTRIESKGARIQITEPLDHTFNLSTTIDEAPKLLIKAPVGDFAYGSTVKVRRSAFTPWAYGAAVGKTIWGIEKSININQIQLSPDLVSQHMLTPDDKNFKIAFVITTHDISSITADYIRRVDDLRRYLIEALPAASRGIFHCVTEL